MPAPAGALLLPGGVSLPGVGAAGLRFSGGLALRPPAIGESVPVPLSDDGGAVLVGAAGLPLTGGVIGLGMFWMPPLYWFVPPAAALPMADVVVGAVRLKT